MRILGQLERPDPAISFAISRRVPRIVCFWLSLAQSSVVISCLRANRKTALGLYWQQQSPEAVTTGETGGQESDRVEMCHASHHAAEAEADLFLCSQVEIFSSWPKRP